MEEPERMSLHDARDRVPAEVLAELRRSARAATAHNYARYSGFMVVAAVETRDGRFFGGSNVEVANYTLTKHAEEMAIMSALMTASLRKPSTQADQWLETLYVCGAAPCGACRQFAWEWARPGTRCVIDFPAEQRYEDVLLSELLPAAFGPNDVSEDRRPAKPAGGHLPTA